MTVPTSITPARDADPGPVPDPVEEPEQDWVFTFGSGQRGYAAGRYETGRRTEPTGFRLDDRYVVIWGTYTAARARMFEIFGPVWSMQYGSHVLAGVARFGLTELVITPDWEAK